MKKVFFVIILAVIAVVCSVYSIDTRKASASDGINDYEKLNTLINGIEGVENNVSLAYGDSIVIAVKTRQVFMKSQEKALRDNIEKTVKEEFPQYNNVVVLTKVKDYYALSGLKSKIDDGVNPVEIYELILDMLERENKQPRCPETPDIEKKTTILELCVG